MNPSFSTQLKPIEYTGSEGHHDEVYEPDGGIRPHWRYLLDSMRTLGPEALADRALKAQRILRDDGATYKVYDDPRSIRTWALDPIPLVIDSEEWSGIEVGLLERAELLNTILKDLYGKRDIIRHGLIPPELVYSHPAFLRECQEIFLPGEHQLIIHSADMVRAADGTMRVLGDRTQAPSGAGYALENRTVMSRVLPSLFRDSHVHRLAIFYRALRQTLTALNPNDGLPRVVVLTPGAHNETYFEHALLANYMGYPLVQGSDLTVRKGYVWMKSLEGLKRVDVIMRRVDDYFCDPVELMDDSRLGVAGLLEVARAGHVAIANPLGTGVLENPALLRYLPNLAKHLIGREPRLATVKTYWCGEEEDRKHVLANIKNLIIKPVWRKPGTHSIFCNSLTDEKIDQLKARIVKHPLMYVAQEYQAPSYSPSWQEDQLASCPIVLRSFAVANESAYTIMAGGLTRVGSISQSSTRQDSMIVTNQAGSLSKDTWVLASEPEKQLSLLNTASNTQANYTEHRTELPSRVVENLYWMGRYAERAEAAMRLLRTVFLQLNSVDPCPPTVHPYLLRAVTHLTTTYPGFTVEDSALYDNPEKELLSVVLDESRFGSVSSSVVSFVNSAEEVKELLSADTQRIINDIRDEHSLLTEALRQGLTAAPEEALDPLVTALLALAGVLQESMIRGIGWRFLDMGRRLERALQTVSLIRALLVPVLSDSEQGILLESVLLSVEGLITYRRRYRGELNVGFGLELLLLDQHNPRSMLYQIKVLQKHIDDLPLGPPKQHLHQLARLALEASTTVQLVDVNSLSFAAADDPIRANLDQLLSRLKHLLVEISAGLAEKFFDHTESHQSLGKSTWEGEK